jgi:hypothetical protein
MNARENQFFWRYLIYFNILQFTVVVLAGDESSFIWNSINNLSDWYREVDICQLTQLKGMNNNSGLKYS